MTDVYEHVIKQLAEKPCHLIQMDAKYLDLDDTMKIGLLKLYKVKDIYIHHVQKYKRNKCIVVDYYADVAGRSYKYAFREISHK